MERSTRAQCLRTPSNTIPQLVFRVLCSITYTHSLPIHTTRIHTHTRSHNHELFPDLQKAGQRPEPPSLQWLQCIFPKPRTLLHNERTTLQIRKPTLTLHHRSNHRLHPNVVNWPNNVSFSFLVQKPKQENKLSYVASVLSIWNRLQCHPDFHTPDGTAQPFYSARWPSTCMSRLGPAFLAATPEMWCLLCSF